MKEEEENKLINRLCKEIPSSSIPYASKKTIRDNNYFWRLEN